MSISQLDFQRTADVNTSVTHERMMNEVPNFLKSHSSISNILILGLVIGITMLLVIIVIMSCKMKYKHRPKEEGPISSSPAVAGNEQADVRRIEMMGAGLVPAHINSNLTVEWIAYIRSCCVDSLQIGEGGFARVYRGRVKGKDLAIKEIKHTYPDSKMWVENEVRLLQGKEHTNINKLYGWCIEDNISYLAYLYIDGCSLYDYLTGNCRDISYSWKQSLGIIMGIARGIEFLHSNKIIHVDIKPQNIMVDLNDHEAKLIDFGLCRHVDWEGTHRSTDKVRGTIGYWAPEYCLNKKLSYKHDVFSFGIVVLQIITGQKHVDEARSSGQFHIAEYVERKIEKKLFEEAVDSRLKKDGWDNIAVREAFTVANIALRCTHPDKARRPNMDVVVAELN